MTRELSDQLVRRFGRNEACRGEAEKRSLGPFDASLWFKQLKGSADNNKSWIDRVRVGCFQIPEQHFSHCNLVGTVIHCALQYHR